MSEPKILLRYTPKPIVQKVMADDDTVATESGEPLYGTPKGDKGPWFVNGWYFAKEVVEESFDAETIARDFNDAGPIPTVPHRIENKSELAKVARGLREWIASDVGQFVVRGIDDRAMPSGHVPSFNGSCFLWDTLCELDDHSIRLESSESFHPRHASSVRGRVSETPALQSLDRLIAWALPPAILYSDGRLIAGDNGTCLIGKNDTKYKGLKGLFDNPHAGNVVLNKAVNRLDDAGNILRMLVKENPWLADYITLPGGKNKGGYSTTIQFVDIPPTCE